MDAENRNMMHIKKMKWEKLRGAWRGSRGSFEVVLYKNDAPPNQWTALIDGSYAFSTQYIDKAKRLCELIAKGSEQV